MKIIAYNVLMIYLSQVAKLLGNFLFDASFCFFEVFYPDSPTCPLYMIHLWCISCKYAKTIIGNVFLRFASLIEYSYGMLVWLLFLERSLCLWCHCHSLQACSQRGFDGFNRTPFCNSLSLMWGFMCGQII